MNRTIIKILFGGYVLSGLVFSSTAFAAKPATVSVYPDQKGQSVGGIGGGIVYYTDWLTNHPNRDMVYDTLFNGLGLSCLRMGNWAIDDVAEDWYSVRNDSIVYADAKTYCGNNLPVLMASWSAPASLKANNNRNGSDANGKASLKKYRGNFVYDWYGNWWLDALKRYRSVGVYPDFVSIQNEPDCDEVTYNTMVFKPTETEDVASYGKALASVASKIKQLDNPPELIGPDNLGIGWNQTQKYLDEMDKSLISGYAFHYYHSGVNDNDRYSHPNDFIEAMQGLAEDCNDKPMFMTENSNLGADNTLDCMYTAWFIANAFNINKVSYYCHWNLIWSDNGSGCIGLQKWDSTYVKPLDNGMKINPNYHGLRHFSKFVRPGMQLIGTWASTDQMTTCGFMSPDGSAYTIVVINQGDDEFDLKHDLDIDATKYKSSVTVSVPEWGVYSMHIGEYGNSVYMPSHSIATITYTLYHPKVSPYVFTFDEATANGNRTNVSNWEPKCVPWASDTILLAKGECKFENNYAHNGPITVAQDATFRLTGDVTANHYITLQGGTLRVYTSKPGFQLSGRGIILEAPSTISVGHENAHFYLNDEIRGNFPVAKIGPGTLDLIKANRYFGSTWQVADGTLAANSDFALGLKSKVVVGNTGKLSVSVYNAIAQLDVNNDSLLQLNADLKATYAYVNGTYLPNGTYTAESHPELVSGEGRLIVEHPYPIIYKPADALSKQTVKVDSTISEFQYSWNYAETVEVDWNPHQPDGISVEVLNEEKTVSFSGTPVESGEFEYKVSSVSYEDSVVIEQGLITVLENETSGVDVLAGTGAYVRLFPSVVRRGQNVWLNIGAGSAAKLSVAVLNQMGMVVRLDEISASEGRNGIAIPTSGFAAGVYVVKVTGGSAGAVLKLVVE